MRLWRGRLYMCVRRACNCRIRDLLWLSSLCLYTPLKLLVNSVDAAVIRIDAVLIVMTFVALGDRWYHALPTLRDLALCLQNVRNILRL